MKKLLVLLLISSGAIAATINPGTSETVSCTSCPPPTVVEVVKEVPIEVVKEVPVPTTVPMPGNAHAVSHPNMAIANGWDSCQKCHNPTVAEPAKVGSSGAFLCSQFAFCTNGSTGGSSDCKSGVGFTHPVTGATIIDPVTKTPVITGGTIGGYAKGATPQCRDCHYPHKTAGYKEPPKSMIHAGCMDCHVGVGKSDLKKGVKN